MIGTRPSRKVNACTANAEPGQNLRSHPRSRPRQARRPTAVRTSKTTTNLQSEKKPRRWPTCLSCVSSPTSSDLRRPGSAQKTSETTRTTKQKMKMKNGIDEANIKKRREEAKHSLEARADPKPVTGCGSRPKYSSMRGKRVVVQGLLALLSPCVCLFCT